MKKKIFTLLTLLLCVCSGAWADTYILSQESATEYNGQTSDGKAKTFVSNGQTFSIAKSSTLGVAGKGNETSAKTLKLSKNTTYTITLPTDFTITAINFKGYTNNNETANKIDKVNGNNTSWDNFPLSTIKDTESSWGSFTYNITGSAQTSSTVTFHIPDGQQLCVIITITGSMPAAETKVATPTCSLGAWDAVNEKYAVTLDCTTTGRTIKYSTDNKASYSDYSEPLALAPGTTLDAYAVKDGLEDSDNMEQYTVPAAPTFFTITYAKADDIDGILPAAAENVESGSSINVPKNYTMYKEGYTFKGWDADGNGKVDYAGGASYLVSANATLTAVFEQNTVDLDDRTAATTIKWGSWKQSIGVPAIHFEVSSGFVVTQATIAGETIDVKLAIDATSGKFKNQAANDWTQVGPGTVFTIPAVEGATITYKQYDNGTTTTPEATATGNTYELTATGTTGKLYYEYIQVVLPKPAGIKAEAPVYYVHDGSSNVTEISTNYYLFKGESGQVKFRVKAQPYTFVTFTVGDNEMPAAPTLTSETVVDNRTGSSEKASSNIGTMTDHTHTYYVRAIAWDSEKDPESACDEVVLVVAANKVTLNASGFSTYSNAKNFSIEGATAYKMALDLDGGTMEGTALTGIIPAGEGVLLKGTSNAKVNITLTTDAATADVSSNSLLGTTNNEGNLVDIPDGKSIYVLNGNTFKPYTGEKFAPNKAYFAVNNSGESRSFSMSFDDETTGISAVENTKTEVKDNVYYNLNGQRVANPGKGLYIVNGKKVIMK